jgi:hypothetical protein
MSHWNGRNDQVGFNNCACFGRRTPHRQPYRGYRVYCASSNKTFAATSAPHARRFAVNEEGHDVKTGEYVVVPTGAAHTFSNPFDEPAAFVTTFTPAYYVNYFRELGKVISAGKEPSTDEMITIRGHYATEPA